LKGLNCPHFRVNLQERYKQKRRELEEQLGDLRSSRCQSKGRPPEFQASLGRTREESELQASTVQENRRSELEVSKGQLSVASGREEEEDPLGRLLVDLEARIRRRQTSQSDSSTSTLSVESLARFAGGGGVNRRDREAKSHGSSCWYTVPVHLGQFDEKIINSQTNFYSDVLLQN
jgi:hypothetical protein